MNKAYNLCFLILLLTSCNVLNHNRFTYHKQSPKTQTAFNTNGVYYKFEEVHFGDGDDRYWASLYYFYRDGSIINASLTMKNAADKDILPKLTSDFNKSIELSYRAGGAYLISGDTLKTQMFRSTGQRGIYADNVIEYNYLINGKNDSIILISSFCDWCEKSRKKDIATDIGQQYSFLPLAVKPDSSKIWYKKTKWYKEDMNIK